MIRVTDDWVIKEDPLNYMPCRDLHRMTIDRRLKDPVPMPEYSTPIGYYQDLSSALRAIVREEIRREGVFEEEHTIESYIRRIGAIYDRWEAFYRESFQDAGRYTK